MRAGSPWNATRSPRQLISQREHRVFSGNSSSTARSVRADVLRVAGQRHPAERPLALAEQRADVRRHEAGEVEARPSRRASCAHGADVVAVVEDVRAGRLEREHRLDVLGHRLAARAARTPRVALAQLGGLLERQPARDVAVQRVVRRRSGRSRDPARRRAAPAPGRPRPRCRSTAIDRACLLGLRVCVELRQRVVEVVRRRRRGSASRAGAGRARGRPRRRGTRAPVIVAASGCAPPMPPRPPVSTSAAREVVAAEVRARPPAAKVS